jgi:hypothetical protein
MIITQRTAHRDQIAASAAPASEVVLLGVDAATLSLIDGIPHGARFRAVREPEDVVFDRPLASLVIVGGGRRAEHLASARRLLAPGGRVWLVGAEDPACDDAKSRYDAVGVTGPETSGGGLLWCGRLPGEADLPADGDLPVIVNFFTKDTPYELEAERLVASCASLGLEIVTEGLAAGASWTANCALKAEFCLSIWRRLRKPIVWLDADAVVHGVPDLLRGSAFDFAIHNWSGWKFCSGTLYFGQSDAAGALLEQWVETCRANPALWDQVALDLAWEDVVGRLPLRTRWLPQSYCQIFDRDRQDDVVIEHFQASRRFKATVSAEPSSPPLQPSDELMRARRAARPRTAAERSSGLGWTVRSPGPPALETGVEIVSSGPTPPAAPTHVTIDAAQLAEIVRTEVRAVLVQLLREPPPHPRQQNYERMAYVNASIDAARYLADRMLGAADLVMPDGVRAHALQHCTIEGLTMEFGVFDGATLARIAALTPGVVHGFDSFEGLPEDWTHFQKKGRFSLAGELPALDAPNIRLHKGWFEDSLPRFLAAHAGPARFIHVDCDLYSSTKTVLTLLRDRIVPGTVIVFDEYLNYPGWEQHEYKAFAEFLAATGMSYRYLGFASSHSSVSVVME